LGVGWGSNKYKIFEKENTLKVQILLKCIILYMTWSHFHFILVSIFLPNFPFYLVGFSKWRPFIIYIFCATILIMISLMVLLNCLFIQKRKALHHVMMLNKFHY
jgi:hypothetical protein